MGLCSSFLKYLFDSFFIENNWESQFLYALLGAIDDLGLLFLLSSSFLFYFWPYNDIDCLSSSSCKSKTCWIFKHSTKHDTISAKLLNEYEVVC
jgi:hypothetical protein